jgi:hypothetical protein
LIGLNNFRNLLHFLIKKKTKKKKQQHFVYRSSVLSIFIYLFIHFLFIDLYLGRGGLVVVNKLYCDKKDNYNVSSYPEFLASELSFLAKIDLQSRDGNISDVFFFHTSNEILFKCMGMISVGDNQASCQRQISAVL